MRSWINQYWEDRALPALVEFGKIPNVSPAYAPEWVAEGYMQKAAAFIVEWIHSRNISGLSAEVVTLPDLTPTVFVEYEGTETPILFYGHYDKQPPMIPWSDGLGPWDPVRKGDLLFGRGLADDGYSVFALIGALEAALESGAKIPKWIGLFEGSEESGSPDLKAYLDHLSSRIGSPRVIVTLDSDGRDSESVWLTQSMRGNLEGVLSITTIPGFMHSGLATGVVPSVMRIFRMLLARFEDVETGVITNSILNPPLTKEKEAFCDQVAAAIPHYAADYHLPETLQTAWPTTRELVKNNLLAATLEVTGLSGHPAPDRAGTITTGHLEARISVRIPAGVDPEAANAELVKVLTENPPYQATILYTPIKGGAGWFSKPLSPRLQKVVDDAALEVYGSKPKYSGAGGTITFQNAMVVRFPDAEHLVTGILEPGSNAHGPDENLNIPRVKKFTYFIAQLLRTI